jgi:uncharacterized protein DUF2442
VSAGIAFSSLAVKATNRATSTWSKGSAKRNFGLNRSRLSKRVGFGAQSCESFIRSLKNTATSLSLLGMSTLASKPVADAVDVECTDDELIVTLVDGRRVSAPLAWFPRLLRATAKQRANWRLIGRGVGIHWDDVDEDISVRSLLAS